MKGDRTPGGLDERAADLLKLLVERYIHDGQPVGSRTLSQSGRLAISPATIRNVMADLEDLGLVASPHTSAGRVPTTRGYRYFVDSLLEPESLGRRMQGRIAKELLRSDMAPEELLQTASGLVSTLSAMAGVVTVPRRNRSVLRRIEFMALSERRVLAILVVNQRQVQNRILELDRDFNAAELERLANVINERFVGQDLFSLHEALLADLRRAQSEVRQTLADAALMAERIARRDTPPGDFVLAGSSNLMGFDELADVTRLRSLFDAFDQKRDLLDLFDRCLSAKGVQLFIGDESGYNVLDECSVVSAPYRVDGEVAGVLSVIGPTRMAYSRIIPLVRSAADALSKGFLRQ